MAEPGGQLNDVADILVYKCGRENCSYQTTRIVKYFHHLRFVHQMERGFSITCGIDGCQKKYTIVQSFSHHVRRKHQIFFTEHLTQTNQYEENEQEIGDDNIQQDMPSDNAYMQVHNDEGDEDDQDREDTYDYLRRLALFVLRIREERKIPQNVCSEIVNEVSELFEIGATDIRESITKVLQKNHLDSSDIDGFEEIFHPFRKVSGSCNALNTEKKQNDFFASHFNFVEPEEVLLGYDELGRKETYMYVPVKMALRALLKHDDVFAEVINGHSSEDGTLRDYCDGEAFKQHPLLSTQSTDVHPPILQLKLYYDDFQIVNPLGPRIQKYKLAGFYYLLGNLAPKFRSKLQVIQLFILCRTALIQKYGWDAVLKRMVADLQSMEIDGIQIDNDGREYTFQVVVTLVIADNLAAHALAGLFESFSAIRCCRFCMATREERQSTFSDNGACLRTKEGHAVQLSNVLKNPSLQRVYGIKAESPLNKLRFFHCIWGMPSDVAHDLFEGFAAHVLESVIKNFVQRKFFTLHQLNHKIRTFPYADCDKATKPSPMSVDISKFKVKQTASSCWCLLRLFPLFVSAWVPENDEYLGLFVEMLDIVDFVCAPVIHRGETFHLDDMISNFLEKFFSMFDDAVIPKAHFLTHYGRQIRFFGPLCRCWTLRFEGKHNYFKELAARNKNKKNVCKSLAYRHQYQQCLYHASEMYLHEEEDPYKGNLFPVRLLSKDVQDILVPLLNGKENVFQAMSVTVDGIHYSSGCCVVSGFEQDTYVFGIIQCVFVIAGITYLLIERMNTEEFSSHLHAYIVSKTNSFELCRISDLLDHHPLGLYSIDDIEFAVVLKYMLSTWHL